MSRVVAVIPARMGSSRFPGKPLAPLQGRTMVEHVFRRASLCESLAAVYVATCDEETRSAVEGFGGAVLMTSAAHERASDRVAEAAQGFDSDIVPMIQGDEPLVTPAMLDAALAPMSEDSSLGCVNLSRRIESREDYLDRNTIKVVADVRGDALYFSRSPIPDLGPSPDFADDRLPPVFKQVCVIPFRRDFLRQFARLAYDLSVVHCEVARQTYLDEGCRLGRVFIHGRRGQYAPMPEGLPGGRVSVGVFLCKDVNEGRLRALAERLLRDPRVSRVVLRPHPKNLWRGLDEWIASRAEPRLSRSRGASVFEDLKETDFVLAGNSSVLVEALTAGRPAAYVPGIDHGTHDLHSFVARGLVYQFDDERGFDPDRMLRFYRRPEWPDALRLFANIDEDEAVVAARVRSALRGLVPPAVAPVG